MIIISENKITLTKVVSLELKIFASKPKMCEMDGNFRLQNGLTLLSRIWTSWSKSKMAQNDINLMLKTIFKLCSIFSENAFI